MASNGYSNSQRTVLILYKISNSDSEDGLFNAFHLPVRGKGPTLASVKQNCLALRLLSNLGADGFHWRVCVEDKPVPGSSSPEGRSFSWWDIQDENALLPIKESSQADLAQFFAHSRGGNSNSANSADSVQKAAKGAFKSFGKALTQVVDDVSGASSASSGPPVAVVAFKLLNLVKMNDDFERKHGGGATSSGGEGASNSHHHQQQQQRSPQPQHQMPRQQQPPPQQQRQQQRPQAPVSQQQRQQQPPQQQRVQQQPQQHQRQVPRSASGTAARPIPPPQAPQHDADFMSFGASAPGAQKNLRHTSSSPAAFETRAERLQREYAKKNQNSNRVWDDVDQRWVEVDTANTGAPISRGTTSKPPGEVEAIQKKKEVGIKLDASSAIGKSADVQAAVEKRVNDMKQSQQKALEEVRQREEQKRASELEEDEVRKKLEPKIKAWSEEHGNKKQLRALLGSLHTILWADANWKPVSLGDLLDDKKCVRCFHKASRVVHPDKTHHLPAEQRFLAKRIFDALSQAKTVMDEGK